ncbi:hypothetical protein L596_023297 [Steinernema carpocapsae]|uniref:F-box domain-containing protein n=2 Tax=Steinernema carpocapsae TaxID=34508 RepID=A0A4U5MDA1_STECR|nr:hypothetical protein L596_023297 [Steinernema carpocapsae]
MRKQMLPNELLLQVFDNLDDATLLECRKVNWQFMEAADKILQDKRRFDVQIHVEKDRDIVFYDKIKRREIDTATIQKYLKDIDDEEAETSVDYLPPFMTVRELHVDARFLSPTRISDTFKILKVVGVQALTKVSLGWQKQHVQLFNIMKLLEEAPLKALELNWYNSSRVSGNAKGFHACLDLIKNVAPKLSWSLSVRGPFSVAEMMDAMSQDAVRCPLATFFLNKARIHAGDGPRAVRRFMESLKDKKQLCNVEMMSSMREMLWGPYRHQITDVMRGFNGSFTYTQSGKEKAGMLTSNCTTTES